MKNCRIGLRQLIQEIHFGNIEKYLTNWVETGGQDLLEGAFIVARLQYPDLSINYLNGIIDDLRQDIWLELNPNLTALEKVRIINHFLFEVHKFSGNIYNMYSPQNSYINQVLETKKGNPVSLSIVYICIAQKLGIPILRNQIFPGIFSLHIWMKATHSKNLSYFISTHIAKAGSREKRT